MVKTYAGIGSRKTPQTTLDAIEKIAYRLAEQRWTLRSGCAPGADTYFERGAKQAGDYSYVQLFLPWPDFEGRKHWEIGDGLTEPVAGAHTLAEFFHPNWGSLTAGARALHARNVHQILGPDLDDPVRFVICWTKDGKRKGGTGQALRIAEHYEVPIFDLALAEDYERVASRLSL